MPYFQDDIHSPHAMLEIASRRVSDVSPVNIFGFNREIGAAYETVWNDGGVYTYPSSAVVMTCVSTSASDTMTIVISGLDADYNSIAEIVQLNGTTGVTTTNSFLRINNATILSGSNVGDISINSGGTVYAFIEAALGTTQACFYSVPNGYSLYLFRIDVTSGTVNPNKYIVMRNTVTTSSGRTLRVAEASFQNNQVSFDRQVPFRIAEKTDFQFEMKSSSGTNEVSIFVEAILVEN